MHVFGFFILVMILYFIFRRPYGMHGMGCCAPGHNDTDQSDSNSARSILDTRYVNGEISDEEYKTKKANLS